MARDRRRRRWHPSCGLPDCERAYIRRHTWFALMSGSELMAERSAMMILPCCTTWWIGRVSVITDISLDHQKFLGNTVAEIAREKAGIIHPGGIVVTLPQQPQANDVIGNTILDRGATAVSAVPYVPPVAPGSDCGYGSRGKSLTTECTEDTERSDHRQPVWRYPLQV